MIICGTIVHMKRLSHSQYGPTDRECCNTCRFAKFVGTPMLECRRRSPQQDETRRVGPHQSGTWPTVQQEDWCGDYEMHKQISVKPPFEQGA